MEKKKIPYESPRTELTPVELENPICSGSADITNPDTQTSGRIVDQEYNDAFSDEAFNNGSWNYEKN